MSNHKFPYPKGSEWRKWDLHIHSDSGSPDEIIDKLIEKGISVFSITDHCSVEKIDKFLEAVKKKQKEGEEIYFLPGIELKTDKGKKSVHALGIFPLEDKDKNQIDSAYLKQNLLSKIDCSDTEILAAGKEALETGKAKEEYIKRGCLEKTVNFEKAAKKIIALGGIFIVHAGTKSSGIETEMKHGKSKDSFDLLNSLGHTKRKLMKEHISVCELPNWNEVNLKEKDFYLKKFNKPSVVFSDSHKSSNIGVKYTWIKGDPTFEGLKQIIYEPELRVKIQKDNPTESETFARIDKCLMDFPKDLEIRDSESGGKSPFCLRGSYGINFSNNLTCIIGGRGSGKSTLIHILYNEWSKKELNRLYEVDSPVVNLALSPDALNKISNFVTTDIPVSTEFFLQNEIEKFAKDIGGMSKLIRHRLERLSSIDDSQQSLQDLEKSWTISASKVDDLVDAYDNITNLDKKIRLLNKEITTLKKQTEVIKSREYKEIQNDIEKIAANISDFGNYEKENKEVVDNLAILSRNISRLDWKKFNNQELLNDIVARIDKYKTQLDVNFQKSKEEFKKKEYAKNLQEKKSELKKYLEIKGMSAENIDELADATEQINNLESQVKNLTFEKLPYQEVYKQKDKILEDYREGYNAHMTRFFDTTDKLQKNLQGLEFTEKTEITFHQKVNDQPLKKAVIDFIKNNNRSKISLSADNIETVIFSDANIQELVADKKKIRETVNRSQKATIHTQILKELLNEDAMLERLHLRIQKHNFDINNIQIQTKLGGKPLQKTSFGERCGIVIAIVLVAGTNPIIMDQPEDNLDGKFVSNVLVPLLRRQKQNRQIILITRDANIVIGGDSELIEILESEKERTALTSSTIENKSNRLKYVWILDGGKEAFQKREQKYSFPKKTTV